MIKTGYNDPKVPIEQFRAIDGLAYEQYVNGELTLEQYIQSTEHIRKEHQLSINEELDRLEKIKEELDNE